MNQYHKGQTIQKRCVSCFNDRMKIIKVREHHLNEKSIYVLYTQCPECRADAIKLAPEDLQVS
ncbi:hypothetical protein [Halobacillus sp. Marseille-Q1614]|uniref:hypothetical protein n=1 Tax=Halobacillus sp. Marseille-Q1614 TaxID=2709134 RepID=UPI00156FAFFB|nr:hypothetical protein [Halobacillus sp. Marseille-Q1614]